MCDFCAKSTTYCMSKDRWKMFSHCETGLRRTLLPGLLNTRTYSPESRMTGAECSATLNGSRNCFLVSPNLICWETHRWNITIALRSLPKTFIYYCVVISSTWMIRFVVFSVFFRQLSMSNIKHSIRTMNDTFWICISRKSQTPKMIQNHIIAVGSKFLTNSFMQIISL